VHLDVAVVFGVALDACDDGMLPDLAQAMTSTIFSHVRLALWAVVTVLRFGSCFNVLVYGIWGVSCGLFGECVNVAHVDKCCSVEVQILICLVWRCLCV